MPFTPTTFVNKPAHATPINAAALNKLGTQYAQAVADGISHGFTIQAEDYGVVGDGVANDYTAVNAFLATAAALGATAVFKYGSTIKITNPIFPPSNSIIDGNGAKFVNAGSGTGSRVWRLQDVDNVYIQSIVVDGDKASYATATEQRHNIVINGCDHVTMRHIKTHDAKGDGIYVGDQTYGASTNIVLDDIWSYNNHRGSASFTHFSNVEVNNSFFIDSVGTSPQHGVDVEPNDPGIVAEDIVFNNCVFSGNAGQGFLVALQPSPTVRQGGVTLNNCIIKNNLSSGLRLVRAKDFTMVGGSLHTNTGNAVLINTGTSESVKFIGVNMDENTQHGLSLVQAVVDLEMIGCTIRGNGTSAPNTYDGINLSPAAASSKIRLLGNTATGASQRYGLVTTSNVSYLSMGLNHWLGNSSGSVLLGDDLVTRTQLDGAGGSLGNTFGQRVFLITPGNATILSARLQADSSDRFGLQTGGTMVWGDGTAGADVSLSRTAVGILAMTGRAIKFPPFTTVARNAIGAATFGDGATLYDTDLKINITSNGTVFKNGIGTTV